MPPLKHFSLCSGIGGIDLAAEWAGFQTVAQCEIDEFASRILAKNFKGVPNFGDIRTVNHDTLRIRDIDPGAITVLSAGFPCQPYSLAGKGLGDGDSRDLWGEVRRCIGELSPKWFIGENTPGLFARVNQRYFKRIVTDLAALGYRVSWGIWGAYDVGAPHKRARVFLLAHADGTRKTETAIGYEGTPDEFKRRNRTRVIADPDGVWKLQSQGVKQDERKRVSYDSRWQTEPDVGRVADGVPDRVDRLRCLGNAVVPAQIYPLFEEIANYERSKDQ